MSRTLRCFIAVEVPDALAAVAADFQLQLKGAGIRARWVPPENVHLTLRFLGSIQENRVAPIVEAMHTAVTGIDPFTLTTADIGVFPAKGPPRVLWLGLAGNVERLNALHNALGTALGEVGIPQEKRTYQGHLTLARFKDRISASRLADAVAHCGPPAPIPIVVDAIRLMESRLNPKGARYYRLDTTVLPGAR